MKYICKYCNNLRPKQNQNSLTQHEIRCPKNPNRVDYKRSKDAIKKGSKTLKETNKQKRRMKTVRYYQNPDYCKECKKVISFQKSDNEFCSRSCSATQTNKNRDSVVWSKQSRENARKTSLLNAGINGDYCKFSYCDYCNKTIKNKHQKFCGQDCKYGKSRDSKSDRDKYVYLCRFQFGISDYPELFDGDIIRKYGWYKCDGKNNNINGVSRDHKISISYGFENNILPYYISHPMNCDLMRHNLNQRKRQKCSITLDELLGFINKPTN